MSLRWKVALALALVSAVATALVGGLSLRATHSRLMEEIDESLWSAADVLILSPRERPRARDTGPLVIVPERVFGVDQYVVQVLDTGGEVLDASQGVALPVGEVQRSLAELEAGRAIATSKDAVDGTRYRVVTVGTDGGAVQVGRYLTETDRVLASLRARTWWLVGVVALASALAGWLLAHGVTKRIRRLTDVAEQVAATGDLDVDTPVSGDDEAGRLGRAFDRMLDSLAASRQQQQRLVEDAGHELRTPLTSLRTNLDVLRRHPDLAPEIRSQVLADLDRDAGELVALVEEVVAVAADRRDDEAATSQALGPLAEAVADRARRRTGRVISVSADESCAVVRPAAIERAISNLIDNAAKFDASDAAIELDVGDGRITVRDRGPGIAAGDLDHVFERFHRATDARTLPGSGLGLAIVAEVAAAHGGEVFARNRDGGGAEVGFTVAVDGFSPSSHAPPTGR